LHSQCPLLAHRPAAFIAIWEERSTEDARNILQYLAESLRCDSRYGQVVHILNIVNAHIESQPKWIAQSRWVSVVRLKNDGSDLVKDNKEIVKYCEKAIEAYTESMKAQGIERSPRSLALVQSNLGNIYLRLAEVSDNAANYKKAIESYREALKFSTAEEFPVEYATIQSNLANTYSKLAGVEDKDNEKFSEKAIEAYREALKVYTPESFPTYYAIIQNNLGNEYGRLAGVENTAFSIDSVKYGSLRGR